MVYQVILGLSLVLLISSTAPGWKKFAERRYYQRAFRDDPHATLEIPRATMVDLIRGGS